MTKPAPAQPKRLPRVLRGMAICSLLALLFVWYVYYGTTHNLPAHSLLTRTMADIELSRQLCKDYPGRLIFGTPCSNLPLLPPSLDTQRMQHYCWVFAAVTGPLKCCFRDFLLPSDPFAAWHDESVHIALLCPNSADAMQIGCGVLACLGFWFSCHLCDWRAAWYYAARLIIMFVVARVGMTLYTTWGMANEADGWMRDHSASIGQAGSMATAYTLYSYVASSVSRAVGYMGSSALLFG